MGIFKNFVRSLKINMLEQPRMEPVGKLDRHEPATVIELENYRRRSEYYDKLRGKRVN